MKKKKGCEGFEIWQNLWQKTYDKRERGCV